MCQRYIKFSESADLEPDASVLAPIIEALQKLQGPEDEGTQPEA